jgi:predicted aldo/keto reductase-like oxidoreductase
MQYRRVPKNGDRLSALGFGTMRLPLKGSRIDEKRAIAQIRYAVDHGVNYVDTGFPYQNGESEKILGKALLDGYREKVKIATKLPPFMLSKAEEMDKILDTQLKKLQTDYVDYYLLHGLVAESWRRLQGFNVLRFLRWAKSKGKIINTGFSFHGTLPTFKEIIDSNDWTMCQIQYNFLDEHSQAGKEGLMYASSRNLAVMIMEPLRGGVLAGNLPRQVKQIYNRFSQKRTAAEWGLRWVWNHPQVTVVLSGMNSEGQIEENIRTCETALPDSMSSKELEVVTNVAGFYRCLMKVPCTGCGYCMPCPYGVNIPANFRIYNQYYMFGEKTRTRRMYFENLSGLMSGKPSDASLCQSCGSCMTHCPQHIAVPAELKLVRSIFMV